MIRLTDQPLDPGALLGGFCAGRTETGAVASFTGLARAEQGAAASLELEAYPGFTRAQIAAFADTVRERFGLHDLLVVHRIGAVEPGQAIVFTAAAAAHRRAAFEACDCLMDYLKSRAPLWKREHGPAGARWIEPTGRDLSDAARWSPA